MKSAGLRVSPKLALSSPEELGFDQAELQDDETDVGSAGQAAVINYKNASGLRSTRLISVLAITERSGAQVVQAYCHARQSYRSFRLDRISEVFDALTGEQLEEPTVFFSAFSKSEATRAQDWNVDHHLTEHLSSLLTILTYLARCDGHFHPKEEEAVEQALTMFCLRMEATLEPNAARVAHFASRLAPNERSFDAALRAVAKNKPLAKIVKRSTSLLIDADGVHAREEFDVAAQIDRVLKT